MSIFDINSTSLDKKTKRLTANSIKRYLSFWGFSGIKFFSSSKSALIVRELFYQADLEKIICSDSILYVYDSRNDFDSNKNNITVNQLIYDLEVFAAIPEEIIEKITKDNFAAFAKHSFQLMINDGWEIIVSNIDYHSELILFESTSKLMVVDDSPNTQKCLLINCGDEEGVNYFYKNNKDKYRVSRHRFLALFREWIINEIYYYFKNLLLKYDVQLKLVNWRWAQNHFLFPQNNITSFDIDQRKKYSVFTISGNEKEYSDFLKSIYGDNYSEEYVKNVMDIPAIYDYGLGCIRHADKKSKYLNILNGERKTTNAYGNEKNTIFLLGGCVFFGYAIDDSNTVASCLQRLINNSSLNGKYKVSNYATWGGNIDETYNTFFELEYCAGDIILLSYAGIIPLGENIEEYDISSKMCECNTNNELYFDRILHCNAEGYKKVAERAFDIINKNISQVEYLSENNKIRIKRDKAFEEKNEQYIIELRKWMSSIQKRLPVLHKKNKIYGAAVMNCNPFTLGHRALIEYASKKVDFFIVFVVEEDKSRFPFEERIELVKKGTKDLKNVFVVPSGNFMISAVTFPGYFLKEQSNTANVDTTMDVEIFGRYIASLFGITKRFVGEEPTDLVTRRYNETMKKVLPRYGVEVDVLERKTINDNKSTVVISASKVRNLIDEKRFEEIKQFVPESTYEYIIRNCS